MIHPVLPFNSDNYALSIVSSHLICFVSNQMKIGIFDLFRSYIVFFLKSLLIYFSDVVAYILYDKIWLCENLDKN